MLISDHASFMLMNFRNVQDLKRVRFGDLQSFPLRDLLFLGTPAVLQTNETISVSDKNELRRLQEGTDDQFCSPIFHCNY